ncbi:microcin C ABC transporter permease YejB [Roseibium aquae]|uniref:Microcin C ABC transporter permease YejB n=1 Tax=Roseibium aquae TaxID=1323746 RepID=A0A916TJ41_9HYPH|nr:microcin C ABC transporter permease YejB [Roseibium aquae]GGB47779.1 microcin C ABC transporter permease YejB [Roseibium aquae]
MGAYILRRLLLMIPTLVGIMAINFVIIQFAPGGPVERVIAQLQGTDVSATARISGGGGDFGGGAGVGETGATAGDAITSKYRGAQGLDPDFIRELEAQFGFDKPPLERFVNLLLDYTCRDFRIEGVQLNLGFTELDLQLPWATCFNFGESYFRDIKIIDLIAEKLPVSISLGLWMTLISYLVSIPLGIRKAVADGSRFDIWTSGVIIVAYAIPGFLFAVLLIVLFAGGSFLDIFPLRGLVSDNWESLSWPERILDYFWHLTLPLTAMVLSAFATTTLLTKNSFLDEIRKQYVMTARAKGLTERQVLYGHVFRNAMLIVVAGFPGAFISSFFAGSLLIETIFSLDGLGLLGFESVINRDYAVVFATLYIFSLMGLIVNLISDLTYTWIDPRIDFETREI